jgi:hypothetical protein
MSSYIGTNLRNVNKSKLFAYLTAGHCDKTDWWAIDRSSSVFIIAICSVNCCYRTGDTQYGGV